jgi:hypothetical protein
MFLLFIEIISPLIRRLYCMILLDIAIGGRIPLGSLWATSMQFGF